MYGLLITIEIILAVFLVIIVLLQSSKGGGLAGISGGAPGQLGSTFGTRRTADFLSKATWYLGGSLLIIAIVANLFFLPGKTTSEQRESIIQSSQQQTAVPTAPALPVETPAAETTGDDTPQTDEPSE